MITTIARRLQAARDAEDGFSIIEVMVAMTIFAMFAAGVAMGIASTLFLTQDNRSREAALNLANQALDAARSTKDVFTLDDDLSTQSVGAQSYTIKRTTNWINSDGTDNSCGAGSGVLAYKRVAITVTWSSGASPKQKSVVLDSLVSPSAAVSSATASTIVVGVTTANGGPNEGVSVSITPRSGGATSLPAQPAATDGNGCSYALGVTPGTYRITITKSGNVDPDGASAPYFDVTTSSGGIGNKTFTYDQGISVSVGAPLNANGKAAKFPTGLTTSFRNGSTVKTTTSTSATLFPYTDGWTVLGGAYSPTCTDVDPSAWTTSSANLVTSPFVFTDSNTALGTPGFNPTSTSAAVARAPMGIVDVKLGGLDTVLFATVKNTSAAGGDPGCSPSTTYTFTGLNSASPTTIALPYGSWTLRGSTSILGSILGTNNQTVSATPGVLNVNASVNGNVVTLDPRTVPAS
ncbi:prepilin-type N-terminal cleavage/methylation domain-containing protein [Curtobacterium sp. MCLR17_007]|uniref:type IV pilus modification PilV family protein n=1 Tax=Curtobacterium sp. MCLR17_007 TaxID=2175648 RepID=UPI0015E8922E|nr:prepilin-type N-terminal cleavage/methylation domain-containing protein [Curtobacterium sp. MCLR17_007]WIB60015.1 prepilin-type N-terminal cleavage/methylation domain-containing protein [Curtobacterium sp. MCLR17_007]